MLTRRVSVSGNSEPAVRMSFRDDNKSARSVQEWLIASIPRNRPARLRLLIGCAKKDAAEKRESVGEGEKLEGDG